MELEGGRWGLVIIASAFMIQVFAFGISTAIGVYNVAFLDYFDHDTVGVSLIASINWAAFLGSGPLASFLMTKMSYRKIAILGSVMTALGVFIMPFLPYIPALCISFGVLAGVGECLVYVPSHVLTGLYYKRHQSLATGIATSGSGLGGAIMPIVIGKLINFYGWKGSLIVMAGLELHLILFAALLRSPPKEKVTSKEQNKEAFALLELERCSGGEKVLPAGADVRDGSVLVSQHRTDPAVAEESAALMIDEEINVSCNGTTTLPAKSSDDVQKSQLESVEAETLNETCPASPEKEYSAGEWQHHPDTGPAEHANMRDSAVVPHSHSADAVHTKHHSDSDGSPAVKVLQHIYLFTDVGFDVYFISSVLWNAAGAAVMAFGPDLTTEHGISDLDSAWLLTIFGLGNFTGGLIGGVIGNIWTRHRRAQYTVANICFGVCIAACPFGSTFGEFAAILVCGGLVFGVVLGLLVVVLIDIIGTDNLGDGLGYIMLANGIGAFIGPSFTGYIHKAYGKYDLAFYTAGLLSVLAGTIMWLIPILHRVLPSNSKKCKETVLLPSESCLNSKAVC